MCYNILDFLLFYSNIKLIARLFASIVTIAIRKDRRIGADSEIHAHIILKYTARTVRTVVS